MHEYSFLLAFSLQIFVLSLVFPKLLIRRAQSLMQIFPQERFPQIYSIEPDAIHRMMQRYRAINWAIVLVGLLLLAGFYTNMRNGEPGPAGAWAGVQILVIVYAMIQVIALMLSASAIRKFYDGLWQNFAGRKQSALLQRRRLSDFVSPWVLPLAAVLYVLFIALIAYIKRNPPPNWDDGFFYTLLMVGVTLLCQGMFGGAWTLVYGKKANPYQSHGARLQSIGVQVKVLICVCLVAVTFTALHLILTVTGTQSYGPFAVSLWFVSLVSLIFTGLRSNLAASQLDIAEPAMQ